MSETKSKKDYTNVIAAIFITGVAGMSAVGGFFSALGTSKKEDAKNFEKGLLGGKEYLESPISLARRAFLWGSVYAIGGVSLWSYIMWKCMGSPSFEEFQAIVRAPSNDPRVATSRIEFTSVTDLMKYVSEEWGKEE